MNTHLLFPLLDKQFTASEVLHELEHWFIRKAKVSMMAHAAGDNTDEDLAMLAEAAKVSITADTPFWPTLVDKLEVKEHAKELILLRREELEL